MTTKAKTKRVLPSRDPQQVSDQCWYYENRGNLEVYLSNTPSGSACAMARIPWRKIIASLKRCQPKALGLAGRRGRKGNK